MSEHLALKVRNELQPLLTPALEATLPEVHDKISEVVKYCGEVYTDQYIREQMAKDCCS